MSLATSALATPFDILGYTRKLENVGFTREQAEVQAQAQAEVIQSVIKNYDEVTRKNLATKGDIVRLELKIAETNERINNSKIDLIKWIIGLLFAQSALIVGIMAFMK